jgi:limonene-1,2-epoxide hydrolase
MRRLPVFLLLMVVFALPLVGCGSKDAATAPADIVASWSQAINASDDETAAKLFAPDAVVIQGGQSTRLPGEAEALAFNSSLPCGGKVVQQSTKGDEVTATFTLTRRPGHMCDGTGESAVTVFRIADGKITLWHELPAAAPADGQSA